MIALNEAKNTSEIMVETHAPNGCLLLYYKSIKIGKT